MKNSTTDFYTIKILSHAKCSHMQVTWLLYRNRLRVTWLLSKTVANLRKK